MQGLTWHADEPAIGWTEDAEHTGVGKFKAVSSSPSALLKEAGPSSTPSALLAGPSHTPSARPFSSSRLHRNHSEVLCGSQESDGNWLARPGHLGRVEELRLGLGFGLGFGLGLGSSWASGEAGQKRSEEEAGRGVEGGEEREARKRAGHFFHTWSVCRSIELAGSVAAVVAGGRIIQYTALVYYVLYIIIIYYVLYLYYVLSFPGSNLNSHPSEVQPPRSVPGRNQRRRGVSITLPTQTGIYDRCLVIKFAVAGCHKYRPEHPSIGLLSGLPNLPNLSAAVTVRKSI